MVIHACWLAAIVALCFVASSSLHAAEWPPLPDTSGKVELDVQDEGRPARKLAVHLVYPGNRLANVTAKTGVMLTLHNWGGIVWENTPNPNILAENFDLLVIGVSYYQSGDRPGAAEPYDYGYVQTMDVLRALNYVIRSLKEAKHPFDASRIYGTGGSGGGNVIQMANKFAPNTFACIVDLSGMASLSDDVAFNLPGGSSLNARYSKDPASPAYLSPDMQEIRDLGNPTHLALQAKRENRCKIVVIHGDEDTVCLTSDKRRVVEAMRAVGLDVEPHFLTREQIDGKMVVDAGHAIGNRTALLMHYASDYLSPKSEKMCRLAKPGDFKRRGEVVYPTSGGAHTISFAGEVPTLSFRPAKPAATQP